MLWKKKHRCQFCKRKCVREEMELVQPAISYYLACKLCAEDIDKLKKKESRQYEIS
jgi:hypothetical protein